MADPRSSPVLPASGEFVYVPVPARDYAAVVQFLVDRVLTRREPGPVSWDPVATRRLHDEVAGLPLADVLQTLADASPGYVPFDELAGRTGLPAPRLRAQLASLTKLAAREGHPSPLRTRPARGPSPTAYQLPPEVASAWAGSTSR
jgi:hypothetical protein